MDTIGPLQHLATLDAEPWCRRLHGSGNDGDPRGQYERDRDRILYSESFRRLQHKTQVFIVTESDLFSTRIHHSIETAQLGRTLAHTLGLNQDLAEAICLGHDVGHTPFGHQGEDTLNSCLAAFGGWDSNRHSIAVLDSLEEQYPDFPGLDLTWATREGIARHKTKFDNPAAGFGDGTDLGEYRATSPEGQVANLADEIAFLSHDVYDALRYGVLQPSDFENHLGKAHLCTVEWRRTKSEYSANNPGDTDNLEMRPICHRRLHRNLIRRLMTDAIQHSSALGAGYANLTAARGSASPAVAFSPAIGAEVDSLRDFMLGHVYKSPLIARQNYKADHVLRRLFGALTSDTRLLPRYVRQRLQTPEVPEETAREVSFYLAGLTDRGAIDLYSELFVPSDRAMGHHVV